MMNRADRIDQYEIIHIQRIISAVANLPAEAKQLVGGIPLWDCNGDLLGVVRVEAGVVGFHPNGDLDSLE